MSVRNADSKNAEYMRASRARRKEKMITDLMKERTIGRSKATRLVEEKLRKKNSQDRQNLRMRKRGSRIVEEEKEEKEEKEEEKVTPLETSKIREIKGPLRVETKVKLNDDKVFNLLSYPEQKLINRMSRSLPNSSVRSLVQYLRKVKSIYKKFDDEFNGSNINLLKDTERIDSFLDDYKGKKDYYWAIINVLKTFPLTEKVVSHYTDIMINSMKKSKAEIRENKKTQKQADNWLNYNNVIELFKRNKNKLNDKDKLLMSFIVFFPRRLQDWYKMKLNKSGKKDMNYNYLNIKRNLPTTFQFFRSKSQGYEDTTKRIPSSLKNMITQYIRDKEIKNNELLFSRSNGEMHTADSFSRYVRELFRVITGKDITSNLWRHIYETHFQDKKYSLNYREELAQNAGHSLLKALEYVKK
jgi:hypothetical protein